MVSTENKDDKLKNHFLLRHFPKLLGRWKGKEVRLCNLTTSHRSITIQVSDNRFVYNIPHLRIICMGPISMKGKFDLETNDLEVREEGNIYIVYDKSSDFELACEMVEIKESNEFEK